MELKLQDYITEVEIASGLADGTLSENDEVVKTHVTIPAVYAEVYDSSDDSSEEPATINTLDAVNPMIKPEGEGWYQVDLETPFWRLNGEGQYFEDPTFAPSDDFDYIHDEESWNASYADGALKRYYTAYPDEDLWNPTEHRAANFNDRVYAAELFADAAGETKIGDADLHAGWGESYQSVTDGTTTYYITMQAEVGSDNLYEAFEDAAATVSAGVYVKLNSVSYPDCIHCWEGATKAPGAKYPWVAPYFNDDVNAQLIFSYEGKDDVQPWGDKVFGTTEGRKDWGCASIPVELGEEFLEDTTTCETTFDIDKFRMTLKHMDVLKVEYYWEKTI